MTQKERIEQLERQVDVLMARIASLEARPIAQPTWNPPPQWTPAPPWTLPQITYGPSTVAPNWAPPQTMCVAN